VATNLKRVGPSRTRWRVGAAALGLSLALAACSSSSKSVSSSSATTSGSAGTSSSASSVEGTLTIGTLYSGSGSFAASSIPQYDGLKFWASQVNAAGGVLVGGLHKKFMVKIVAYNDQSDPTTAATLYNQLITQNHVDILASDFGSVLTAPAVTLAQEHKIVLFDPTGTGATFFSSPNPYLVLTSLPTSAVWPKPAADFILSKHISKVAIVYCANDFDQSQANTIKATLATGGVTPVYFQAVPTSTSDYGPIIQKIQSLSPEAVIELGYQNNDIAFLNDLRSASVHFPFVLTAFPTQLPQLFAKDVGASGLAYTFGYGVPPVLQINNVNYGMGFSAFEQAFSASNGPVSFLNVAGYQLGLVIQDALAHAASLDQLAIRAGVTAISGQLKTLTGTFIVNDTGAQLGELLPVAQDQPSSSGQIDWKIVYPADQANAQAVYPAPAA